MGQKARVRKEPDIPPGDFSTREFFCRIFWRKRAGSPLSSKTGVESISLTPQYRPRTSNGFCSILSYGSFSPYRAQTSNEAPNFETARKLLTGSEVPFFPKNLKDFKPHYIIVDNNLYGAVSDRRPESFDGNLSRKGSGGRVGRTQGTESGIFVTL